ncbi:MAG: hypothetical protein HETSPECPRED_000453 [Heterodermia speciosa]|uniref:Fcf2 pre-rRNA processing C-terminal domain-containing protein n=1 Tax=Heterodermia speciosa TaxID=116794 RepID=A0A8H3IB41_9LECA|nr:MAG: hypothetical protein HETSPECPRED_000453 [Heterodermia speciosa]
MPYDLDSIDENITDEQIEQLLQNAEKRIRNSEQFAHSQDPNTHPPSKKHQLRTGDLPTPYIKIKGGVAHTDTSRMLSDKDRLLAGMVRRVEDPVRMKAKILKEKKATAGSDWFNLPRTDLTPELKRDLQLLKMRNALDPKRHYKKENGKTEVPEFSQIGTFIQGPTEFYSSRIPNKERKKNFVDEVLTAEESTGRFKSRYNDIQSSKMSGKKAYYKKLKNKRSNGIRKR